MTFREKIYRIVANIPEGYTLSYKEVAKMAGKPRAYRAVGNILNKNKDYSIPCYRVVRSDGKSGGYNLGAKKKVSLLKKDGVVIKR